MEVGLVQEEVFMTFQKQPRGSPYRLKVPGLLVLPLLAIAIAVTVFAFSAFSTSSTAHAANEVTSLAPDAAIVIEEVTGFTPGIGMWTLGMIFDDNFLTTTILATNGTIAGGADPGTGIAPAATTFDKGVNSGIVGIAITMISAILVIGTFAFTGLTRRQLRRAGQLNNDLEGKGTNFQRLILWMGRVALGSFLGVAQTVWRFTTISTEENTQAKIRSSTA